MDQKLKSLPILSSADIYSFPVCVEDLNLEDLMSILRFGYSIDIVRPIFLKEFIRCNGDNEAVARLVFGELGYIKSVQDVFDLWAENDKYDVETIVSQIAGVIESLNGREIIIFDEVIDLCTSIFCDKDYMKLQREYLEKNNIPNFLPSDGNCYKCGKNVFDNKKAQEVAGSEAITGCPYCGYSFVS